MVVPSRNHHFSFLMITYLRYTFCCILIILFTSSSLYPWGFDVHKQISTDALQLTAPELQSFFTQYTELLLEKSIEPDTRKDEHPAEFPRHFLDIDHYGEYPYHSLPMDYKKAVKKFSADTVINYGTLPWWIDRSLDSLTQAMKNRNAERIIHWAGFLGPYVADAHQPLHAVLNYNGQLTGNDGIHFRYEIGLPEKYMHEYRSYPADTRNIRNPLRYAFRIIRESSTLADSIMHADTRAMSQLSPEEKRLLKDRFDIQRDSEYFQDMYKELGTFTWNRLRVATTRVSQYWNLAWQNAGKPQLSAE